MGRQKKGRGTGTSADGLVETLKRERQKPCDKRIHQNNSGSSLANPSYLQIIALLHSSFVHNSSRCAQSCYKYPSNGFDSLTIFDFFDGFLSCLASSLGQLVLLVGIDSLVD